MNIHPSVAASRQLSLVACALFALSLGFADAIAQDLVDDEESELGVDEIIIAPDPLQKAQMSDAVIQSRLKDGARLAETIGRTSQTAAGTATIDQAGSRSNRAQIQQHRR